MAINISFDEDNLKEKEKQDVDFLDSIFSNNGIKQNNSENTYIILNAIMLNLFRNKAHNESNNSKPIVNLSSDKKVIDLQIPPQKKQSRENMERSEEIAMEQLNLIEDQKKNRELNIDENKRNNNVIIIEEIPKQSNKEEKDQNKLANETSSFKNLWKKCFAMFNCCKRKEKLKIIENKNVENYKSSERKPFIDNKDFEDNGGEFKKMLGSKKEEPHESWQNLIIHK